VLLLHIFIEKGFLTEVSHAAACLRRAFLMLEVYLRDHAGVEGDHHEHMG
jgi:hypothetical protein